MASSTRQRIIFWNGCSGGLPPNETTFARILHQQGYSTALVGMRHSNLSPFNCLLFKWGCFCNNFSLPKCLGSVKAEFLTRITFKISRVSRMPSTSSSVGTMYLINLKWGCMEYIDVHCKQKWMQWKESCLPSTDCFRKNQQRHSWIY